jgi:hypothetical protein
MGPSGDSKELEFFFETAQRSPRTFPAFELFRHHHRKRFFFPAFPLTQFRDRRFPPASTTK